MSLSSGKKMESKEIKILQKAIDCYGIDAPMIKAIAAMATLTKTLCNQGFSSANKQDTAQEIALVEIALDQMKLVYENQAVVEECRTIELNRLERALHNFE